MTYATVEDVEKRIGHTLSESEQDLCDTLLEDAVVVVDSYNKDASEDAKKIVSCNLVIRRMPGDDDSVSGIPMGATQGSQSGLGYAQSWTVSGGGAVGEMYLSKLDKRLLGAGNKIGSYSPVQELVPQEMQS